MVLRKRTGTAQVDLQLSKGNNSIGLPETSRFTLVIFTLIAFCIGMSVDFLRNATLIAMPEKVLFEQPQIKTSFVDPTSSEILDIASSVGFRYNTTFSTKRKGLQKLLSPPNNTGKEAAAMQIASDLLIVVGGFTDDYNGAVSTIQFLNITTQEWMPNRTLFLPPHVAQTHVGIAFDPASGWLYLVAGQMGGGCGPATDAAVRVHLVTGEVQDLPSLPQARYQPGVAIINGNHLHVFAGADSNRYHSARDHWRLVFDETDPKSLAKAKWETLAPTLDGGTHGRAWHYKGYIYYTAFCDLDQPVFHESSNMAACQSNAVHSHKQGVHHATAEGLTMRYATEFVESEDTDGKTGHWERLFDIPFPSCHMGMTLTNNAAVFVGGGITTSQVETGSPPVSLPMVQVFDMDRLYWRTLGNFPTTPNGHYYNMWVWVDESREHIFAMRGNGPLVAGRWEKWPAQPNFRNNERHRGYRANKISFLIQTVTARVYSFRTCLSQTPQAANVEYVTVLDPKPDEDESAIFLDPGADEDGSESSFDPETNQTDSLSYERLRLTWNRAKDHLQYPDIIALPTTAEEVAAIVQCAIVSGHHVCGRNGKHSFESDTCTHGVVVDVSRINHVTLLENKGRFKSTRSVRMGAGLTLGRVAVDVEHDLGMVVPVGHCATVGLTGLVLVGGQGTLSRLYGMTVDYVSTVQLVNAEGQIIRATPDNEYADLLWLARGGGSAVQHFPGIITEIEMKDLPLPETDSVDSATYTVFRVELKEATVPNAVKLLTAWQDFYTDPDNLQDPLFDRITVEPGIFMNSLNAEMADAVAFGGNSTAYEKNVFLACYFYGTDEMQNEFQERFVPKLKRLAEGLKYKTTTLKRFNSLDFHKHMGGVKTAKQLASGHNGWELNKDWKGFSAVANDPVHPDAFQALAENILEARPYSHRYAEIKPLRGKIQKTIKSETAFWHRDALWWVVSSHFYTKNVATKKKNRGTAEFLQTTEAKHNEFISKMGESFGGMYAGYIHHGNSPGRDLELYYGDHAQKISEIKMARDPFNVFQNYVPTSLENAPFQV